jgi:GDP-L-fucose synthase
VKWNSVVVSGGTGFIGARLKNHRPKWTYLSSRDYDLLNKEECNQMFKEHQPDAIIHLAAKVGGIKENANNQASFYYENIMINTNILECAHRNNVKRTLSSLSTCAFPDVVSKYPFLEEDLFKGPPAKTNFSYGYTKRALHVQAVSYRKQYGLNYSTFCPSNIYGPGDNFNSESSHFIPALIKKIAEAKEGDTLELWGTGTPLRQQLYIDDLVEIIPLLLEKHNSDMPIIVAPNENLSISEMANILHKNVKKNVKIVYNNRLDGQFRKDGSNKKLLKLLGGFNFTKFEDGVTKTYEWYKQNKQ